MPRINVLDQSTINQIAAGEVIERPASVVKELLENAIDAKATAVTIEIKEGGISFIRITDNGCGISKEDVPKAFLSHATSKIESADDLFTVVSLGFRGEALSSIAAVAQVELITKTPDSLTGTRYQIEGGLEKTVEEIGAPEGTTFIVRNLFFNTPVRKKFLKTPQTEGSHIAEVIEKIALSHPEVSIRFIQNNQNKLHTSGNHNVKDMIYTIFGREIAGNLLTVDETINLIRVSGYIGKPVISRANRNYENYFINGRYIRNPIIAKAIEEAFRPYMMQHKYPFTLLYLEMEPEFFDINVHPAKMELRFKDGEHVYRAVLESVKQALADKELIPQVSAGKDEKLPKRLIEPEKRPVLPEPFEKKRMESLRITPPEQVVPAKSLHPLYSPVLPKPAVSADTAAGLASPSVAAGLQTGESTGQAGPPPMPWHVQEEPGAYDIRPGTAGVETAEAAKTVIEPPKQLDLFDGKLLEPKARKRHRIIGQLFDTYWMVEFNEQLFIIDQHAAHEKVLYEQTMASLKDKEFTCQMLEPPIILTLSTQEELLLNEHLSAFTAIGFEIEPFGGREYAVRGVPGNLFSIAKKELFIEMLDELSEDTSARDPELLYNRVATMSCKAAVKGNNRLSLQEVDMLIDQLLELENPYACPHGRPTIISMSKYEIEKKFKRIV